jgi:hypothetical protein
MIGYWVTLESSRSLIIPGYMLEQETVTKNIKVSDEVAKRLAAHGGFHSTYAQIITMLLDHYEGKHQGTKENKEGGKK